MLKEQLAPMLALPPAPDAWTHADNAAVLGSLKGRRRPSLLSLCLCGHSQVHRAPSDRVVLAPAGHGAQRRAATGSGSRQPLAPAGRYFQAFANRRKYSRTFSEQERVDALRTAKEDEVDDDDEYEVETADLLSLDPRQWKACRIRDVLSGALLERADPVSVLCGASVATGFAGARPLRRPGPLEAPLPCYR